MSIREYACQNYSMALSLQALFKLGIIIQVFSEIRGVKKPTIELSRIMAEDGELHDELYQHLQMNDSLYFRGKYKRQEISGRIMYIPSDASMTSDTTDGMKIEFDDTCLFKEQPVFRMLRNEFDDFDYTTWVEYG